METCHDLLVSSDLAYILVRHAKQDNLKEILSQPTDAPLHVAKCDGSCYIPTGQRQGHKKTTLFRELIRRMPGIICMSPDDILIGHAWFSKLSGLMFL